MDHFVKFLKSQWFTIGLLVAVSLGFLVPQGARINVDGSMTAALVALVFVGIGFTLPSESLISGFLKWRLHLYIQSFIFILTPLFFFFSLPIIKPNITPHIYIGLVALAVLPTTISTCSVLTMISDGDVSATLFNASFSNLFGVIVSPVLLSILLTEAGRSMPLSVLLSIILSLVFKMVIPLVLGQILRFLFKSRAVKSKSQVTTLNNLLILSVVYLTIAKSASTTMQNYELADFFIPLAYLILVHFCLLLLSIFLATAFKFNGPETISVMYAAPQKTMAMGVPLLTAYFASEPALLSIAILPLLFYHPWQIVVAGFLKSLPYTKRLAGRA